jgi:lipopolysaccharide export system protein LptA
VIGRFIFGFIVLRSLSFIGQGTLTLLPGSEKVYYDKTTQTHRLVGTVSFTYQGNTMYCDSAFYKEKEKIVRAFGHVHITKDDIDLYCDSLFYSGTHKFARLWGHVNVRDAAYKLSSDSVEYHAKSGLAVYKNKGRIENSLNRELITSKVGYFYPKTGSYFFSGKVRYKKEDLTMATDTLQFVHEKQTAYFHGRTQIKNDSIEIQCSKGHFRVDKNEGTLYKDVLIRQKDREISCDTAIYQETNQWFTAKGQVFMVDNKRHLNLIGAYFHSQNNQSESVLAGNATALEFSRKDTLFLQADTLRLSQDSLDERIIKGYQHVRIYTQQLQAKGDSTYYRSSTGNLSLYKNPMIWSKNAELKGDTVHLFLKDSTLESAQIDGNASAIIKIDTLSNYNQLAGKKITAWFHESELEKAKVVGQAWTIYYPIEETKEDSLLVRKRMGLNRLYAREVVVDLDRGEVVKINFVGKPDGVFYPMDQIDEKERFIRGFSWNPTLRPKKPSLVLKRR